MADSEPMITKINDPRTFLNYLKKSSAVARWNPKMAMLLRDAIKRSPAFLAQEILGLTVKPFHSAWLKWQMEKRFTMILAPRGHGKSILLSATFLLWKILCNPNIRILLLSSSGTTAERWLRYIKKGMQNECLVGLFGNPVGIPWAENQFTVAQRTIELPEPTMLAMGLLGAVTGGHVDVIILDDVVTAENARSRVEQENMLSDYYNTILPCLMLEKGEIHILGTRYAPQELYGKLLPFSRIHTYQSLTGAITEQKEG